MIIGGDLGGTKTLLALAEQRGGKLQIIVERRYASKEYASFEALLDHFLADAQVSFTAGTPSDTSTTTPTASPSDWLNASLTESSTASLTNTPVKFPATSSARNVACFGVAGPTDGRRAQLTYLPWQISASTLESRFGLAHVELANDFAAAAHGLPLLADHQCKTLQAGKPVSHAPRLILGAGTGLGVASMIRDGQRYRVIPGEGGHIGFAPQTPEQGELWRWLLNKNGRVTTEDIVSGPGLTKIYAYLGGRPQQAEQIGQSAIHKSDALAIHAVELWFAAWGGFAGDLALLGLPYGGIYLAGGIAAKLMPHIGNSAFLAAFNAKREHQHLVEAMPIHLVTEERLGLLGALALAEALQISST